MPIDAKAPSCGGSAGRSWGSTRVGADAKFALWAPTAALVEVLTADGRATPLVKDANGWHRARVAALGAGDRYSFRVDGLVVPDPASRSQPDGVDGASEIADASGYCWGDAEWRGRPWTETVLYELHVGTFSKEGTYLGAIAHLDHLAMLGVTMIELMPVASYSGARNWGYDGVLAFAPSANYGTPDDLRRLIDEAHSRRISVVLDVVFNHFGPASNRLADYAPEFFTDRHKTPWGGAIAFDGPHAEAVRAFFVENAVHWLVDYHCDGLRLDAVQAIFDDGPVHIMEDIAHVARTSVSTRAVHLMIENDNNQARWLEPGDGAGLYDAQWNDDFHHVMRVLLAGQTGGYYEDYADAPLHRLGRALAQGFSYQGEESLNRPGLKRGTPSAHLPPTAFVSFLQNHDQVGNSAYGQRITDLAPKAAVRLGTAVMLLAPQIPMLFMGQEWGSSRPFNFFCDYPPSLADAVRQGRREEFRRFPEFREEAALDALADPNAASTCDASINDWREIDEPVHAAWLAFHRHLLHVRHTAIVPLLSAIGGNAGSFRIIEGAEGKDKRRSGALEAQWALDDGRRLVLAANFSDETLTWTKPEGAAIYRLSDGEDDRQLLPWDLVVVLVEYKPARV